MRLRRGVGDHRRLMKRKVHYFVLDLPHSDATFAKAYPAETTEALLRRTRVGVLVPGRSPPEHPVRQHEARRGQDTGRRSAPAHPRVHRASVALPVLRQVLTGPGKGQRQGEG